MTANLDRRRALHSMLVASLAPQVLAQAPRQAGTAEAVGLARRWPAQPVRLLVGFPPGSVQDLSARAIAPGLSIMLGHPVVVENKAGASGIIAADAVSKSQDRHTFGVCNNSQLTIAKMLNPACPYEPGRDLTPVGLIATTPLMLVVSKASAGRTPQEHLAWLRHLGEQGNYGSPGNGTPGHLGMELLKARTGLSTTHIPYPGNPQVITAMIGQQLHAALLPPGLALQQVQAGKLQAIGVTSEGRSPLAPEQPTLRELDIKGAEIELWSAMAGPRELPREIRDRLSAVLVATVKDPETRTRLFSAGWQASASNEEGLRARMDRDTIAFGQIISRQHIRSGT